MFVAAQLIEKNHFLVPQNRAKTSTMIKRREEISKRRTRLTLLLIAVTMAIATLAPVVVLAG